MKPHNIIKMYYYALQFNFVTLTYGSMNNMHELCTTLNNSETENNLFHGNTYQQVPSCINKTNWD